MTEHCINNGTSICQTEDATHLVVNYEQFTYNNTIGGTYSGKQMELMFHFTTDHDSYDDRLILCVTSMSNRTWYVILYDDPYDNTTSSTLKVLLAKETIELYTVRDFEFNKHDELLIYIRFGEENVQLFEEVIEKEEMLRLYKCLKSLYEDNEFSDMTVQGKWPAHRAVVAAASKVLDEAVSNLPFNKSATEDCNTHTSTNLVPARTDKSKADAENVKEQETELQSLTSQILDVAASNFLLNNSTTEDSNVTTRTYLVPVTTDKNKPCTENVRERETELQCLASNVMDEAVSNLPFNKSATEYCISKKSTDLVPATTEKSKTDTENVKEQETELQSLTNKILDVAASKFLPNKSVTEDSNVKTRIDIISATTDKNKADSENVREQATGLQCLTSKSLDEAVLNLLFNKSATKNSDATPRAREQETKLQQLVSTIFTFTDTLNINIKDFPLGRLIKDLQNNLEEDAKSSADDEINFNKPKSSNYMMDFTGLTLSVAKQLLSYIYTGDLYVNYENDGDDDEIVNLFITVVSYKIQSLLKLLENKCIGWIRNDSVNVLIRCSQLFKLEKLRLEAIKHIRGLPFQNSAKSDKDLFIYKCILSTPTHKFRTYGNFTITIPNISKLGNYTSKKIFFCGKPLLVDLGKYLQDDVCYLSLFVYVEGCVMMNCYFAILNDRNLLNHRRSIRQFLVNFGFGFKMFIRWEDLMDPNNSYVRNDAITLRFFVEVLDGQWLDSRVGKDDEVWTDSDDG